MLNKYTEIGKKIKKVNIQAVLYLRVTKTSNYIGFTDLRGSNIIYDLYINNLITI